MLPGLLTMYQQIGSFGPAAKHKTVSGHVPTGGVPEADLLTPGLGRSAETRGVTVTDALRLAEDRLFWRQIATEGSYG